MKLRRHFLTGLLVLAPTMITGWIVWKIFITVDSAIEPFQRKFPVIDIPGLGFVIVLLLIFLAGFLASNLVGRRIILGGERLFTVLPLIRRIYTATKDLSEVFLGDKKSVFRRVVLVRFPHRDSWGMGFVTNEGLHYFDEVIGEEVFVVFLPTTPNPTTGFFLLVPKREAVPLDVTVEDALKMVISGGVFTPQPFSNHPAARP